MQDQGRDKPNRMALTRPTYVLNFERAIARLLSWAQKMKEVYHTTANWENSEWFPTRGRETGFFPTVRTPGISERTYSRVAYCESRKTRFLRLNLRQPAGVYRVEGIVEGNEL